MKVLFAHPSAAQAMLLEAAMNAVGTPARLVVAHNRHEVLRALASKERFGAVVIHRDIAGLGALIPVVSTDIRGEQTPILVLTPDASSCEDHLPARIAPDPTTVEQLLQLARVLRALVERG